MLDSRVLEAQVKKVLEVYNKTFLSYIKNQDARANDPKHLQVAFDAIKAYLEQELTAHFVWAGVMAGTPPVKDTTVLFAQGKVILPPFNISKPMALQGLATQVLATISQGSITIQQYGFVEPTESVKIPCVFSTVPATLVPMTGMLITTSPPPFKKVTYITKDNVNKDGIAEHVFHDTVLEPLITWIKTLQISPIAGTRTDIVPVGIYTGVSTLSRID